ncbi:hypothetical protein IWQ61_001354 [Dispira simplex]|nr:hypothetical protein IWQ61_001354 [Dispira simplex]
MRLLLRTTFVSYLLWLTTFLTLVSLGKGLSSQHGIDQMLQVTYRLVWFNVQQGRFGTQVRAELVSPTTSNAGRFTPEDQPWAMELGWTSLPSHTVINVTSYSATAGNVEETDQPTTLTLTELPVDHHPVVFDINFQLDSTLFQQGTNSMTLLAPDTVQGYYSAHPNTPQNSVLLVQGDQWIIDLPQSQLPSSPPFEFGSTTPNVIKGNVQTLTRRDTVSTSEDTHDNKSEEEQSNPYGTVLEATPIGLILYSVIVGIAVVMHLWGLLFRIRCKRLSMRDAGPFPSYQLSP